MLNVHDHYQNMKHAISADKTTPDKALSLVKEDFFDTIKNIVLEHQQWHKDRKVITYCCCPSLVLCTDVNMWALPKRGSLAWWLHCCPVRI